MLWLPPQNRINHLQLLLTWIDMPLDLEEQEQLDNLKAFWVKYRSLIMGGLTACLLAYSAYAGFQWWKNHQALEASKLYETLISSISKGDNEQTFQATQDMQQQFPRTSYASMASLVAAKVAFEVGDIAKSQSFLRWASIHSSDDGYMGVAKVRLVSQLIEQGGDQANSEADQILKEKPVSGFEALWLERRGDWYLAQKKASEARNYYQEAWKKLAQPPEAPEEARRLLKVKLDSVGGLE